VLAIETANLKGICAPVQREGNRDTTIAVAAILALHLLAACGGGKPPVAPQPQTPAKAEPLARLDPPAAAIVSAKPAGPAAPGTVTYPAAFGKVTFDHPDHAKRHGCPSCHGTQPPVKIALSKDSAHKLCKTCHEAKAAGPTKCIGCHVK
jgi:hypothetical protein